MLVSSPVKSSSQSDGTHAATAPDGTLAEEISNGRAPKSKRKRSSALLHAQIISALQRGECCRTELAVGLETNPHAIRRFLDQLRDLGAVYVKERVQRGETSRTELFALNATPFENEDAPRVKDSRPNQSEGQ